MTCMYTDGLERCGQMPTRSANLDRNQYLSVPSMIRSSSLWWVTLSTKHCFFATWSEHRWTIVSAARQCHWNMATSDSCWTHLSFWLTQYTSLYAHLKGQGLQKLKFVIRGVLYMASRIFSTIGTAACGKTPQIHCSTYHTGYAHGRVNRG